MKKVLLVSVFFLLISILAPKKALAQCNPTTDVNCFNCTWTGIQCVANISSQNCQAGFGISDAACSSNSDLSSCQGDINNDCVSTQPPSTEYCYECVDTITGCIPRSPTDTKCEYRAPTQSGALNACNAACTGQVPTRFSCVDNSCQENSSGPYDSLGTCAENCGGQDPTCKTTAGEDGINTAIGCIPISDTNAFIGFILRWTIGVGGGIAFLLIVYSAFMIMTSQGNPERLKAGQELLTSAIAGLIMLIFSVFILKIIGVDILRLPGFGS